MVADIAQETATFDNDIHRLRHIEFYAATEGMNLYLLILTNDGISQVHTDAAAESVKTGTVERLATIDVLIATVVYAAADALAVFTNRQRTL